VTHIVSHFQQKWNRSTGRASGKRPTERATRGHGGCSYASYGNSQSNPGKHLYLRRQKAGISPFSLFWHFSQPDFPTGLSSEPGPGEGTKRAPHGIVRCIMHEWVMVHGTQGSRCIFLPANILTTTTPRGKVGKAYVPLLCSGHLHSRLKCPGHDKRRTTEAEPSETKTILPNKVGTEAGNGKRDVMQLLPSVDHRPILSVLSAFRVPFPHGPMFPCFHVSKALMSAGYLLPIAIPPVARLIGLLHSGEGRNSHRDLHTHSPPMHHRMRLNRDAPESRHISYPPMPTLTPVPVPTSTRARLGWRRRHLERWR